MNRNTSNPFFSAIIPVYNKEPHISRSVNSVLNQTFSNFELILVDDGSTDDSLKEIKKFKDPRIIVHENPRPTGPSAARNTGVRHAKGDWVSFLDADDEWASSYLEKVYDGIQKHPEVGLVSCGWKINDKNSSDLNDGYYKLYANKGDHVYNLMEYIKGPRPICTSVATIKRELIALSGGFNEDLRHEEDQDLWLRLLLQDGTMGLWLPFVGATYHKDSVNMVSKNRPQIYSPVVNTIKAHLKSHSLKNENLRDLLKKYSNARSKKLIKRKVLLSHVNMSYLNNILFWDALCFKKRLFFFLLTICPHGIQKLIIRAL